MLINNMLVLIAVCSCGLIDNLFVGRLMGKDALAAVGFFSPVTVAVGFSYVIILGTQVLAGNLIGAGKTKEVNRLFASAFSALTIISVVFALVCLVFHEGLATILGANGESYVLLCDYIKGYAPGIIPQMLAAMIVGDVLGDWLLIGQWGFSESVWHLRSAVLRRFWCCCPVSAIRVSCSVFR